MLTLIICVVSWTLQAQSEHKDLNSPERVKALYEITMKLKAITGQIKDCQNKYNTDIKYLQKQSDSLTSIAVKMQGKSDEFLDHNLDLQAGILGLIKESEKQKSEIDLLKASKSKNFVIGAYGGYDLIQQKFSVGLALVYKIFAF